MAGHVRSEVLENAAAHVIGAIWSQIEELDPEDHELLYRECERFWYTIQGLNRVSIGVRGRGAYQSDGIHFDVAINNEMTRARGYIISKLGEWPDSFEKL